MQTLFETHFIINIIYRLLLSIYKKKSLPVLIKTKLIILSSHTNKFQRYGTQLKKYFSVV